MGYLTEAIGRRCPDAKLLVIYYDSAFLTVKKPDKIPCWHPRENHSLLRFLHRHLSDLDMPGLSLLSWPGSDRVFPTISRQCSMEVGRFIRERTGSLTTTGGFGRRWIRNAFQNFLSLPGLVPLRLPKNLPPLIIAASGPSLGESLDLLKKYRRKFALWALPSALEALASRDILPDLIIQTDPGYYAFLHLRELGKTSIPLAMPLTSVRGLWRSAGEVHLFSQGSIAERAIIEASGTRLPTIASTGTVAAAAFLLAEGGAPPWVMFTGLDLCSRNILSHTRPHSFEALFIRIQNRLAPHLGFLYRRTMADSKPTIEGRQSPPLRTYREWMEGAFSSFPRPLYRLNPSSIDIKSMHPLDPHAAEELLAGLPGQSSFSLQVPRRKITVDRSLVVSQVFASWKKLLSHQKPPPSKSPGSSLFSSPRRRSWFPTYPWRIFSNS